MAGEDLDEAVARRQGSIRRHLLLSAILGTQGLGDGDIGDPPPIQVVLGAGDANIYILVAEAGLLEDLFHHLEGELEDAAVGAGLFILCLGYSYNGNPICHTPS